MSNNMEHQVLARSTSSIFAKDEDVHHGDPRLIILMTGLPARGKSYISKKLQRYLSWLGYKTKTFNVGNYRRQILSGKMSQDSSFFNPEDSQAKAIREELALAVLDLALDWLKTGQGQIAIHDATNSTRERRSKLLQRISQFNGIEPLFIESILTDPQIIEANIQLKVNSPDYKDKTPAEALADFRERLKHYERSYQPLDDEKDADLSYIKLINIGKRVITNNIHGYLPSEIVFYLMNYHIHPRAIWLTLHGETDDIVQQKLGGDAPLNKNGQLFAYALRDFIQKEQAFKDLQLWHSTLVRAEHTARPLRPLASVVRAWRDLNEISVGSCEGLTEHEFKQTMAIEYAARQKDRLRYRYPQGGESYLDVISRLKPIIIELERLRNPVLIIGHRAVVRTIYAYFKDINVDQLPFLNIPLHTVIKLTPTPFVCEERRFIIDVTLYEKDKAAPFCKELSDTEIKVFLEPNDVLCQSP